MLGLKISEGTHIELVRNVMQEKYDNVGPYNSTALCPSAFVGKWELWIAEFTFVCSVSDTNR